MAKLEDWRTTEGIDAPIPDLSDIGIVVRGGQPFLCLTIPQGAAEREILAAWFRGLGDVIEEIGNEGPKRHLHVVKDSDV